MLTYMKLCTVNFVHKLFKSIYIVYVENRPKGDPLIVGFTGDVGSRSPTSWLNKHCKAYLIYAWDMDKDRDKLKLI
jgi:hypothetical protein